jgi:alcohol dehydrogenase (cytochrome c)
MTRFLRRLCLLSVLSVPAVAQVTDQDLLKAAPQNWLTYSGSFSSQRHSLLKQINKDNAHTLVPKWIYHVPTASAITWPNRLETSPIVVDGVMYVTQPHDVFALDGRTGRLIWQYRHQPAVGDGPNRGVAVYGNRVYFTSPNNYLIALDARTGNLLWQTKIAEASDGHYAPNAPLAFNGKVIVGFAGGDDGVNGFMAAYDASTGERLWRWDVVPKGGEPGSETWAGDSWKAGGGDTWMTGSYDPELNLIYWGTGNPSPNYNGEMRKGDNLYTDCMVALDANTGKLKWYFQFTPHDTADWDAVEIPVLVDAPFEGKMRKLLVQADRNGFYYVLDRTNGKFLHGTTFVKSVNWASGLTPEGRPILVPGVEPSVQGTKICPSTSGATNWMSPAFSPDTGLFYVTAIEGCGINTKSTQPFRPGGYSYLATGYIEDPDEQRQSYVRALNLTTGKLAWEFKQVYSREYGAGLLSTAGGLIFAGCDEGLFTALDAKTGAPLWHFNMGERISAAPVTYSIKGRQYVALASATNVVVFGLFDGAVR